MIALSCQVGFSAVSRAFTFLAGWFRLVRTLAFVILRRVLGLVALDSAPMRST
jgi:hypothetical protein